MRASVNTRFVTALVIVVLVIMGATMAAAATTATGDLKVVDIEIKGNKLVTTQTVQSMLKTKVGEIIPSDKLESRIRDEDLKAINESGLFADQVAKFETSGEGIKVTYELVENPTLTGIAFRGNTQASAEELNSLLKSKVGSILNTKLLQDDLDRVVKYYAGKGGMVSVSDIQADTEGKLTITLAEAHVEKIVITGNTKTKDKVIRRELKSKVGALLNFNTIRDEQRRILNLGYFDSITPKLEQGSDASHVIYTIELVEKKKLGLASGGLGYSATDGLMGYLDVTEDNLMGNGQKLTLKLEAGTKGTKTYELGFYEPWLDANRTSMGFNLYNREVLRTEPLHLGSPVTTYSEKRRGGDLSLGRPLDQDTRFTLKLKNETTKLVDSDKKPLSVTGDGLTRSVTVGVDRDTRDNYLNPTSGYRMTLSAEKAGGALGGDNEFAKLESSGSAYLKAGKKSTVAVRVSGGSILHNGDIPVQEKFRLGGADSIRGYDYGALQGDSMVNLNAEYRFPIVKILTGAIFADAGDAWMASEGSKGLKVGGGMGIRLDTPLGLLRLDYGLTKGSDGKLTGKTYFSFGQTF